MVENGVYKDSEITSEKKQIEEMAKVLRPILENRTDICFIPDLDKPIAEELIKHYQPKLPEDSVVLSKEEYEEYKKVADGKAIMVENITDLNKLVQFPIEYDNKFFDDIANFGNYVQEQERKETVEKIYKKGEEFYKISYHKSNALPRLLEWIEDTFSVEIKE